MQWLILIALGLLWAIGAISESISKSTREAKQQSELKQKRNEKYGSRTIDRSQSLYERNKDIVSRFAAKITGGYQGRHYMDDLIKDCLNEICLAEGQMRLAPNYSYLYRWESAAPVEWKNLSQSIRKNFENAKSQIDKINRDLQKAKSDLAAKIKSQTDPREIQKIIYIDNDQKTININVIRWILRPNDQSWEEREKEILSYDGKCEVLSPFECPINLEECDELNNAIRAYNDKEKMNIGFHEQNKLYFNKIADGYAKGESKAVVDRINYIVNALILPGSMPKIWEASFDPEEKIAIVDVKLPDVFHTKIVKSVELKTGTVEKPLNKKEALENVPNIHPALILRVAYEIFRNDSKKAISLLVMNGWVEFDDPATGNRKKTYTSSIALNREQMININLSKIEPLTAFTSMKGKSAGKLIEIIPVVPVISLNRKDSRFIETKRVLNELDNSSNLAAMDWQDFENLIAELFEKEFQKEGVEVKVTQASRDRGVDAVIFDPDPIKGGKFVVQAKRYTNTVDVSAVRDLCAVVKKEGASRGILVTTSSYGADAYEFAKNEPVTLLNGGELLGLLQKHGYVFRIDLKEARKLNIANAR